MAGAGPYDPRITTKPKPVAPKAPPLVTVSSRPSAGSFSRTPKDVLNRAKSDPTAQTVAGTNSLVPVVYGRWRLGAKIVAAVTQGQYLYLSIVWCVGPIDAIEELRINDELPAGLLVSSGLTFCTHYNCGSVPAGLHQLGTLGAIDPWLQAAFLAKGTTYTDTNPGACYSVIRVPAVAVNGFPIVSVRVRGMLVRQTQAGARVFSDNPAYCLADFIEDTSYGAGLAANWTDVATVAADADTLIGSPTEKKRLLNISLDSYQSVESWINVLRDYAGCFAILEGGVYNLPLDAATSVVATFDGSNIVSNSMRVQGKTGSQQPTVVVVEYTDTSGAQYRTQRVTQPPNGVPLNGAPRRDSVISKSGLNRYSEANRYAIERFNDYSTAPIVASWRAVDDAIKVQAGDIVAVNHPIGFGPVTGYATGKPFRVLTAEQTEPGRWNITGQSFDPAKYSSVVVPGPTLNDTVLPSPASPPVPTNVVVTEDVYQVQTGYFGSRLHITWDATTYPFLDGYIVTVTQNGVVKEGPALVSVGTEYLTKALTENLLYVVSVQIRSTAYVPSTATNVSITNNGKQAKPSDVPLITGFEVGGEVRLNWTPATDLDLTAHELRYSVTGGSWASATLLDRVAAPSVRYDTKAVPAGTWRFWIKGLDSVRSTVYPFGQESVNAAFVDITVTSDSNAFVAGTAVFSSPTLTHMTSFADGIGGLDWQTDFADTWASLFTSALSTYTNPLNTYHTAGTSGLVTEVQDMGVTLSGDWFGTMVYQDLAGTATRAIEINSVGGEATTTITGATNATPIVLTITAHPYVVGDEILVAGVGGNTNANGRRLVSAKAANTVTLTDLLGMNVAGNGAYTSGGTASRWNWNTFQGITAKGAGRYVRQRISTPGTVLVTDLGTMYCNAVARRESALVTTLASGPLTVLLAGKYQKLKSLNVTAQGSSNVNATYDNICVNPADSASLQLQTDVLGPGNAFVYWTFSTLARVIASGDFLEYEVFVPSNSILATGIGGIEIDFTDTTSGRSVPLLDQNGAICASLDARTYANGVWFARKISMTGTVGKTSAKWQLVCESDTLGTCIALYRNIRVTDGAGTTRATLYSGGAPSANVANFGSGANVANSHMNQSNAVDLYAFNSAGTQVAAPVSMQLEGI